MSRRSRFVLSVGVTAAALLALAPAYASAVGSISGTVKEEGTNTSLSGVTVCATNETTDVPSCSSPSVNGVYAISPLTEGDYEVEFIPSSNHLKQWYSLQDTPVGHTPVHLNQNESKEGIDATVKKGAKITGEVLEGSTPVAGVEVCPTRLEPTFANFECVQSQGDGSYEAIRLTAGTYVVEFYGEDLGYLFQMYDGVGDESAATKITLAAGGSKADVDAHLIKGSNISGAVTEEGTGALLKGVPVTLYTAGGGSPLDVVETGSDGSYKFKSIAAGGYKVGFSEKLGPEFPDDGFDPLFYNGVASLEAAATLQVTTGNSLTGINAKLHKTGSSGGGNQTPPTGNGNQSPTTKPLKCKRGFRKKKVRGKTRCVKKKKKKKHRR